MNDSNQTLKDLTLADLEQLIITIVERTLQNNKEVIIPDTDRRKERFFNKINKYAFQLPSDYMFNREELYEQ